MADEFNKENGGYSDGSAFQQNQGSANEGAGTGNGSYNYNQGEYHNTYSNAYGSNQAHGNASNGYGQNNNGGAGNNRPKKGKGKAGKAAFAILLAVIVGASAGVGAWGINKVAGNQNGKNEASANLQIDPEDGKQEQSSGDTQNSGTDDSSAQSSEKSGSGSSAQLSMNDSQAVVTDVSKVVEKVMPSMVSVYNNFTQTRQDFFGQTYSQQSQATGSGIIIGKTDTELLIVTNNHVVADADSLQVQFQDENTADASIKGTDETNDLAVIAVKLSDIKDDTMSKISIATLGNSDNLVLGEPVVAIGNALGYGQSVTTGVVSALNREITQENNETGTFIQTDAAINPGNSGGALVDLNGNVIGINSSKIGGSAVEGMGYAIPISKAEPIIESLMNQTTKEKVSEDKQGYLGISGVSVTSQVSSAYNMPQGVYVAKVISGTGAADSDLQKGDIITAIEGSTVQSLEQLQKQLTYYEAGSTVTITVKRASANGEYKEQEIKIKLTDKKTMEAASDSEDSQNSKKSSPAAPGNGNGSQGNSGSGNGQNGNGNNGSSGDDSGEEDDENGFYQFPWSFFGN